MIKVILVSIVVGLFGVTPVLAAENCTEMKDNHEIVMQCDLKVEAKLHMNMLPRNEITTSSKNRTDEKQKKMENTEREDNAILDELSKQ